MSEDVSVHNIQEFSPSVEPERMDTVTYAAFLKELAHEDTDDYSRFLQVLPTIISRFESDITTATQTQDISIHIAAGEIAQATDLLLWRLAGTRANQRGIIVEPRLLEKLYSFTQNHNRQVRNDAIEQISNVIFLDDRNKGEQHLHLARRFHDDLIARLLDPENKYSDPQELRVTRHMVTVIHADFNADVPQWCIDAFAQATNQEQAQRIVTMFASHIRLERVRQILQEYTALHPEFRTQFEKIEGWMGIIPSDEALAEIAEVYNKTQFEKYKPNEALIDYEGALLYVLMYHRLPDETFLQNLSAEDRQKLEGLLRKNAEHTSEVAGQKKVLDIGFGTGRHMKRLMEMGIPVVGIDAVQRHAEVTQNVLSEAKLLAPETGAPIVVGSWHRMPFADESFTDVYCLGRSELHNATVTQAMKFLAEANRVLKEGGYLYIDIPDPDKGDYAYERERYQKIAEEQDIDYYEDGAIVDSPDGVHFFDRLAPMKEQFIAWAFMNGFDAELIDSKEYEGHEKRVNTNWYWRLRKRTAEEKKQVSPDQLRHHMENISTAGSNRDISRLLSWR